MFDDYLRKLKDRLIEPIAQRMSNIAPTTLTFIGLIVGIASAVSAYFGLYFWSLVFWLINRSLDGLDGLVARVHNKQNDFGGYIDTLSDFVVYAALPIGIVMGRPTPNRYIALIAAFAFFYINTASWMYLAAILEKIATRDPETKTTIVMPSGLIGGFETIVFFSVFIIYPAQIALLLHIYTALVVFTILQRVVWANHFLNISLKKGNQIEEIFTRPRFFIKKHAKQPNFSQQDLE